MYVKTSYLKNLIYNVLLWTPGKGDAKKYQSQGLVKLTFGDGAPPTFLSTDGYVVVVSGQDGTGDREVYFKGEDLKEILRNLPTDVLEMEVTIGDGAWFFGKQRIEPQTPEHTDFWEAIEKIAFGVHHLADMEYFREFYLDPRRLQKFSLVEPRSEYPLAFKPMVTQFDQPVFLWKYGPDLFGVLSPLQIEAIVEAYPDNADEVMW